MPDLIDANGLQTKTFTEILDTTVPGMEKIYGEDTNFGQNSPDGQMLGINAQEGVDIRELITGVYNSFNPDRAVGKQQDERYGINYIERNGGTFTIVPIDITVSSTVSLDGLDAEFNSIKGTGYTIADNAGTNFILIDSQVLVAGSYTVNFRAAAIGQVEVTLGTITNQVTFEIQVVSLNNSSAALEIGQNEETDAEFRLRRQKSTALSARGYLNGLLGRVLNLDGVTDAVLFENVKNAVDADGIPAHGIWLIVEGGANTDIVDEIYSTKSFGANMKGAVQVNITTDSGVIFVAKFDRPTADDLYIRFNIQPTITGASFDLPAIKQYIVDNLDYNIGQPAETSTITCIAKEAIDVNGGGGVPVDLEISDDNATWVAYLETATKDLQWTLDTSRIAITVL